MTAMPPRVLAFSDYYLPGFRSGALRSLANLVDALGDRFELFVVTRDRDSDRTPHGVATGRWTGVGTARVLYLGPEEIRRPLGRIVEEVRPDVVYLNSLFSSLSVRVLLSRRFGSLRGAPFGVVVAPRGELAPGALSIKRRKKAVALRLARAAGLFRGVRWSATHEAEREEIRRVAGAQARVVVVPDLAAASLLDAPRPPRPEKRPGALRLVFLSRLSPVKNLPFLLETLAGIPRPAATAGGGEPAVSIHLDVWGSAEDPEHRALCEALARRLPPHVAVAWRGAVPHERVAEVLAAAHLFVLPTLGESFGHAIVEALAAGVPVLVSDRTPWRGLAARRAGWDLPLSRDAFRAAILEAVAWDDDAWRAWSAGARALAEEALASPAAIRAAEALLSEAAGRAPA